MPKIRLPQESVPTMFSHSLFRPKLLPPTVSSLSAHYRTMFAAIPALYQQRSYMSSVTPRAPFKWHYPSPYEYALMSSAIYSDELQTNTVDASVVPPRQQALCRKGWRFAKAIQHPNDYRGGIFVHTERKQAVIVHRGSQNITSWITDYETVCIRKPGGFVKSVIDTLSDEDVLSLRRQGYRLTTTGHSLGGFLAQISVYWSLRREQANTHYPEMSAVVFDSPGAVEFLEVLQSNLRKEQEAIPLNHLNVHNFSAMPTIVSTYGTHTGTIWHLAQPQEMRFAFVNAHPIEHILSGFEPETDQPKIFRQMLDWPKADYSKYNRLEKLIAEIKTGVTWFPFKAMNALYKSMKPQSNHKPVDTWFDQIFNEQESQVVSFLKTHAESGYVPSLDKFEDTLSQRLKTHYISQAPASSEKTLHICHFSPEAQFVLTDLVLDRSTGQSNERMNQLKKTYSEDECSLLQAFDLRSQGGLTEVVLLPTYAGTIFEFHQQFSILCNLKPYASSHQFLKQSLAQMEQRLSHETAPKAEVNLRSAIAAVQRSLAIKMTGPEDYRPERIKEIIQLATELRQQGFRDVLIQQGCAVAKEEGSIAVLMPSDGVSEKSAEFVRDLMKEFQSGISSAGGSFSKK